MMSAADCTKRAAACLKAAQFSSDHDGQRAWRQWSDLWAAWSETRGRLSDPERIFAPFPRIARDAPPIRNEPRQNRGGGF
jgi:hypothetical protein